MAPKKSIAIIEHEECIVESKKFNNQISMSKVIEYMGAPDEKVVRFERSLLTASANES